VKPEREARKGASRDRALNDLELSFQWLEVWRAWRVISLPTLLSFFSLPFVHFFLLPVFVVKVQETAWSAS